MDLTQLAGLLGVTDLGERLALVETRLMETLGGGGPSLTAAARRMTAAGGKRLRPAFVVASAQCAGAFDERVMGAAVAVELVQVGSLVHDDIFEDASTRRGVPTINSVEGPRHALMAGDFLLARAGVEAAVAGQEVAADVAATVAALCEGQMEEMRHVHDVDRPVESYLRSIGAKTAALFACAMRCGARCGELPPSAVERLGDFGYAFGMAFQVLDDVLDLVADPDRLGKPVGIDIATGVYTLPVLRELASPAGGDLRALLRRRADADVSLALRLMRASRHLDTALTEARRYAAEAAAAVADASDVDARHLASFPGDYLDWALDHFTRPSSGSNAG